MPNNDLISRTALLNDLSYCAPELWQDEEYVKAKIMKHPTVDAAPVIYAHWEEEPNSKRHWHCSNCKTVRDVACIAMNYCPHCGAKMAEHPLLASGCGQTFCPDKEEK